MELDLTQEILIWFGGESVVLTLGELGYDPDGMETINEFINRRTIEVTNEKGFGWCFY